MTDTCRICKNCTFLLTDTMRCVHGSRRRRPNDIAFPATKEDSTCEFFMGGEKAFDSTPDAINIIMGSYGR